MVERMLAVFWHFRVKFSDLRFVFDTFLDELQLPFGVWIFMSPVSYFCFCFCVLQNAFRLIGADLLCFR